MRSINQEVNGLAVVLGIAALGLIFFWLLFAPEQPVLLHNNDTYVGCRGEETEWQSRSISDPICQEYIKNGKYDTQWVSPGWRP